jgi:hypothetical protein
VIFALAQAVRRANSAVHEAAVTERYSELTDVLIDRNSF